MTSVLTKTIRDRRRGILAWSLVFAGLVALYSSFYPAMRDQMSQLTELMSRYPEPLKAMFGLESLTSPSGYLNTEFFALMVPLFFLTMAIGFGSSTTIAEEESKTMDLLMSNPIKRRTVLVQKFLGFTVGLLVIAIVLFLALIVGTRAAQMSISASKLGAATWGAFLVGVLFGALALAAATFSGRKGITIGVCVVLAILSFVINSMSTFIEWLEPLRPYSPLYHSGGYDPLANGFSLVHSLALLISAAVLLVIATVGFERRDLGT